MTMENLENGIPMEESGAPVEWQDVQQPGGPPEMPEPDSGPETEGAASVEAEVPEGPPPEPEPDTEGQPPETPPKRKRTSRKKAEKAEDTAAPESGADAPAPVDPKDSGELPVPDGTLPGGLPPDGSLSDDDLLDPKAAAGGQEEYVVMGLASQSETGQPDGQVSEEGTGSADELPPAEKDDTPSAQPAIAARQTAPRPRSGRPAAGHSPLLSLKLRELDRNLTKEERQEWNDIYASYRSKSVLTGKIIGVEGHPFNVRSRETGQVERRTMYCTAVISYRVKVLIPETEMWMPGEERPVHVLRNLSGAEIDYVILDVDRQGGMAIASRRMAAAIRRHVFDTARNGHEPGERLTCRVLAVGPSQCLVECGGRDITLRYQDMSYSSYSDLRKQFRPGEPLDCILKSFDRASGRLVISVKEAYPNPFDGAVIRHPLGCRRQAVISGKYGGGVFCTMPDGTTCLCLYTAQHTDRDFREGDTVIVVIVKFDYERSLIYGRILSKW